MGIQDLLSDETNAKIDALSEDKKRKVERRMTAGCFVLVVGATVVAVTLIALLIKLFIFIVGA